MRTTVAPMIRTLRTFLASALVVFGISLPASAVTSGTDFTDLWFNPGEGGWGLNVIHEYGIIFVTLYVYDASGTPHFYSASETRGSGNSFTGRLYETRGTYFATTPYNPSAFGATAVGTLTLNFSTPNSGTLTYNVGAINVVKSISRFTFAVDNLSGNYLGGLTASSTCSGQSQFTLVFDTLRVTQTATADPNNNPIIMTVSFFNSAGVQSTCVFSGIYAPMGRLGNISGTYSCTFGTTAGNAGSFTISNIESSQNGWNGRFTGSDQFCSSHSGYFGGVRDVI